MWLGPGRYDAAAGQLGGEGQRLRGGVSRAETHAIWQAIRSYRGSGRLRIHSDNPFTAHGWWVRSPEGMRENDIRRHWQNVAVIWEEGRNTEGIAAADRAAYPARIRSQHGDAARSPHNEAADGLGERWSKITWGLATPDAGAA